MDDRDAFNLAIDRLRALRMALDGAESITEQGEADALQFLAYDALRAFESVKASIESARPSSALPDSAASPSASTFAAPGLWFARCQGAVVRSLTTMVAFSGPPTSSCNCFARALVSWRVLRMGLPWPVPGSFQLKNGGSSGRW